MNKKVSLKMRSKWFPLVKRFESSSLNVFDFASLEGVNPHTFRDYYYKFRSLRLIVVSEQIRFKMSSPVKCFDGSLWFWEGRSSLRLMESW